MPCFVPFNCKNLDITFFVFKPVVVLVDELIDELKNFSVATESLGCVYSSIFKSIHGNLIVWYGAWMKRPDEQKKILHATLISMLDNVSSMAILLDTSFFNAYAGESKDGFPAAKFTTGDTISMIAMLLRSNDLTNLSYACLALFKSYFLKMEGVTAGVCCNCDDRPRVVCLFVWKSLHSCYSWLLNSDYRSSIQPYLEPFSPDVKFDIFRVVYVSSEDKVNMGVSSSPSMVENGGENNNEEEQSKQVFEKKCN